MHVYVHYLFVPFAIVCLLVSVIDLFVPFAIIRLLVRVIDFLYLLPSFVC